MLDLDRESSAEEIRKMQNDDQRSITRENSDNFRFELDLYRTLSVQAQSHL